MCPAARAKVRPNPLESGGCAGRSQAAALLSRQRREKAQGPHPGPDPVRCQQSPKFPAAPGARGESGVLLACRWPHAASGAPAGGGGAKTRPPFRLHPPPPAVAAAVSTRVLPAASPPAAASPVPGGSERCPCSRSDGRCPAGRLKRAPMPGVSTQPRRPASRRAATTAPPRGGSRLAAATAAGPSPAGASGEAGSHPLPPAPPCLLFCACSRAVTHYARAAPRPEVCPGREPLVALRARRAGRAACGPAATTRRLRPSRRSAVSPSEARGAPSHRARAARRLSCRPEEEAGAASIEPLQPGSLARRPRGTDSVLSPGALLSRTRSAALLCFRRPIYVFLYSLTNYCSYDYFQYPSFNVNTRVDTLPHYGISEFDYVFTLTSVLHIHTCSCY